MSNVCILRTDGTNCDEETAYAFRLAGGKPRLVHVNELRNGTQRLGDYQILAIPGGFSYGDDIASGRVLANELVTYFAEALVEFLEAPGKLVIGICNGFQVLVRAGILPARKLGTMGVTLAHNASDHFNCRWITTVVEKSPCVFLRNVEPGQHIPLPVAHGEGRFWAPADTFDEIERQELIVLRYFDNPNGSQSSIAGICDQSGRVFGLMPHPERFVEMTQHPNWRRLPNIAPLGRVIFENAVAYANEHA